MKRNRATLLWIAVGALLALGAVAAGCGAGGIDEEKIPGPVTIRDSSTPTPDPHTQPPNPPGGPLF